MVVRPATVASGAFGDAAELDHPLGQQIDVLLHVLVDFVEQLVQGDELRALHVPVGLLALGLEIDAVGEPPVEQLGDLGPGLHREVVLGREQPGGLGLTLGT